MYGPSPHPEQWAAIVGCATTQYGLIATRQLRAIGVGLKATKRLVSTHRLRPYRLGVYLVAGSPDTRWQPLMAACLAVGPPAAASFRSAAELYGYPGVAPAPYPEITVFGECSRRLTDICAHRSDRFHECDLTVREQIPVTSPARTLVDLGRFLSLWMLAKTYNHILRKDLAEVDDVAACLERIGGRGRPGTVWLRILTAERRLGFHPGDNDFELTVGRALRREGVPEGTPQFQVVVGRYIYVLDRAWPDAKVGLEVDGDVHLDSLVADHDAEKRNRLTAVGWDLYYARPHTNLVELARHVLGALRARTPGP